MNQNNIKPQELRIGNWVYRKDIDQNVRISQNWFNSNIDVQPIPLSEEVLLKAGFKNGGYDLLFWYKDDIELYGFNHVDTDNYVLLTSRLKEDVNVRIYYLHQLQNLFYSLTGEELEVRWT